MLRYMTWEEDWIFGVALYVKQEIINCRQNTNFHGH